MRHLKLIGTLIALSPSLAFAHVTNSTDDGFSGGIVHAFSGLDHLAALWCLGALAALFALSVKTSTHNRPAGDDKKWLWLPGLFAIGLAAGAYLAAQGLSINPEPVIGGSILFWGSLLVLRKQLNLAAQIVAGCVFALFHGLAHGPILTHLQHPIAFYCGISLGLALSFCTGFIATQHLKAMYARWVAGLVSLVGLGSFALNLT